MKRLCLSGAIVLAALHVGHQLPRHDSLLASLSASVLASVIAGPALAHSVEKGPMGGRLRHIGKVHVELLLDGDKVRVHLYDDDSQPLAAKGHRAVVILQGVSAARIVLEPTDGNQLTGAVPAGMKPSTKAVVQLTKPDGTSGQARFE